jgi:plastocyanin
MKTPIASVVAIFCAFASGRAGGIAVTVNDSRGVPVADAVVYADAAGDSRGTPRSHSAVIDQQNQQFVPYVSAIQVGTAVTFPNKDNIRHHVYSFSPAKKFELPLYAGIPAQPVLFDKEGIVTLGCNIHDWMLAYVVVLRTPFYQVTGGDGRAHLRSVPAGTYKLQVWQPRMRGSPESLAQTVEVSGADEKEAAFNLDLKPEWRSKKAPALDPEGYR